MLLSPPRNTPPLDQPVRLNRASMQATGLVGWWPTLGTTPGALQGRAGTMAPAVGTGNPTLVGNPVLGQMLSLDGSTQKAQTAVGTVPVFQETTPFSTSCWFATTTATGVLVLNWDVFITAGWRTITASGALQFGMFSNNGNTARVCNTTATSFADGSLYHCVTTYDGSSSSAGIKIYVNGVSQAITSASDTSPGTLVDAGVSIGDFPTTTHLRLAGTMGDIRIYSRALSAAEIWQMWAPQTRWDLYAPVRQRFVTPAAAAAADDIIPLYQRIGVGPMSYGLRV